MTSSGVSAINAATGVPSNGAGRIVKFHDGTVVPALGQGSAGSQREHSGLRKKRRCAQAFPLGMALIDTAELYGSEELIGRVIADQRDRVFLSLPRCRPVTWRKRRRPRLRGASDRLGTDYLDLYLLHWPNGMTDFSGVVSAFHNLRSGGKIRAWGVSNFNISHLEKLFHVPQGDRCATNQVPYNFGYRGIEHDVLPWCERRAMPVMACRRWAAPAPTCCVIPPLDVLRQHTVARQPLLRWLGPSAAVTSLQFRSGSAAHVKENAVALSLTLTPQELQALDAAHPPPSR